MTKAPLAAALAATAWVATSAWAVPFTFSTGDPDGKIATASRQASAGKLETETADDFILQQPTSIDHASFTGLIPLNSNLNNIKNVEIEIYHVFPGESTNPPSGNVPTRVNSPGDVEIASATRDGVAGDLSFSATALNQNFAVANTVVNGINKIPNQTTGGEGATTGEEVRVDVTFTNPIVLPADHYFFRPEVLLADGSFLFLSAAKPIVGGTGPFNPDLQSWTRNTDLKPDWLRIGTDIVGAPPGGVAPTFNAAFSLNGQVVPEPSTYALLAVGGLGLYLAKRRSSRGARRKLKTEH
jgi:hypothetical protein